LGKEVWKRLIGLRYGIIGLGRTGSSLTLSLGRIGTHSLTLVDPDIIESHNLGEMQGVTDADIGRPKVEAVADFLRTLLSSHSEIVPVIDSITHRHALQAVKACDALLLCSDHDSARLAATMIAALFCKPLIDIASGVYGQGDEQQMGADVRLMLPGQCLLCYGGLRNEAEARQLLASANTEHTFHTTRNWQSERAGSLASLNGCATSIALRLLEDLVAERVRESMWAHIEFDTSGRLTVSYPESPKASSYCRICELTGCGEEGLLRV